ncbi:MAG TPA: phage tail tape measure protein, partial [Thermoleophilia bacterium]|nr:phage tail tape measure protein [Thermoleophilia bacterium]
MTRVAAIASGSRDGFDGAFKSMSASALDLAGRTEFTAQQVGEGMEKMAMAGFSASKTIAAMPAVLQLSSAASLDLASSADIVTNVMAGFGKGASELLDVNNALVATFTGSNVSLGEIGEAMKTAGPVSKALGVSIEQTAQAIGLLGNAGIKGSEAGTGLKRAFTSFVSGVPKTEKAMKALGISAKDLTDPNKGIGTVIAKLEGTQAAFAKSGKEAEFTGLLFKAFGERAGPKMAALVEQGADSFDKLGRKIEKAKATNLAEFLESAQVATFTGQLNILRSAIEKMIIAIGQQLIPLFKPLVKWLQQVATSIGSMAGEDIRQAIDWIKKFVIVLTAIATSATLTAALLGIAAAIGAASTAAATLGIGLGALAVGPLAAAAVGAGAFALTLDAVEAATGETYSMTDILAEELLFASGGFTEAKTTATNFGLALVDVIASIVSLGALHGIAGGVAGWFSDAANDAKNLTSQAKEVFAAEEEIANQMKAIAKYGDKLTIVSQVDAGGSRTVPMFEVNKEALGVLDSAKGFEQMVARINNGMQLQAEKRRLAMAETNDTRLKGLKESQRIAKEAADEEKAAADDVLKRAKERADAMRAALKFSGGITDEMKEQAKALDKITQMARDAERSRMKGEVGAGAPILSAAFQLEDTSAALAAAFEAAKLPAEQMQPILDDMNAAFTNQVTEFVKGKRGTKEFSEMLELAGDVVGAFGLVMADVVDKVEPTKARILPQKLDTGWTPAMNDLLDSTVALEATLQQLGFSAEDSEQAVSNEIRTRLQAIDDATEFRVMMLQLSAVADDLGVDFERLRKTIPVPKGGAFDKTTATIGTSPEQAISKGLFDLFHNKTEIGDENLKAMTNNIGSGVAGAMSGSGFLGPLGGAIGAAFGQPIIGAAIGSAIEGVIDTVTAGLGKVVDGVIAMIPDEKLRNATQAAASMIGALAVAAFIAYAVFMGLAGVIGPIIILPLLALAATLGPLAIVVGVLAAAFVAVFIGLAFAVGLLVAAITGFVLGPLALLIAGMALALGLFFMFGALVTQTESFKEALHLVSVAVDEVVKILGDKLGRSFSAFVGLFSLSLNLITPLLVAFATGLNSMAPSLFNMAKGVIVAFGELLLVSAHVGNAFIDLIMFISPAVVFFLRALNAMSTASLLGAEASLAVARWFAVILNMTDMVTAIDDASAAVSSIGTSADDAINGIEGMASRLGDFKLTDAGFDAIRGTIDQLRN